MKARELPGTPNEQGELLDEITSIATEARDPDPRAHVVSSRLAAVRRRAADLLALASRARRALLPSHRPGGAAPGR
jgi:hypothetical protein